VFDIRSGDPPLLGVSESWALDRHVDEFLTPADARNNGARAIGTMLQFSTGDRTIPQALYVRMRTSNGETVTFRVRVGPCGPPAATLLVFTEGG
jgi:hypothetical protein